MKKSIASFACLLFCAVQGSAYAAEHCPTLNDAKDYLESVAQKGWALAPSALSLYGPLRFQSAKIMLEPHQPTGYTLVCAYEQQVFLIKHGVFRAVPDTGWTLPDQSSRPAQECFSSPESCLFEPLSAPAATPSR